MKVWPVSFEATRVVWRLKPVWSTDWRAMSKKMPYPARRTVRRFKDQAVAARGSRLPLVACHCWRGSAFRPAEGKAAVAWKTSGAILRIGWSGEVASAYAAVGAGVVVVE